MSNIITIDSNEDVIKKENLNVKKRCNYDKYFKNINVIINVLYKYKCSLLCLCLLILYILSIYLHFYYNNNCNINYIINYKEKNILNVYNSTFQLKLQSNYSILLVNTSIDKYNEKLYAYVEILEIQNYSINNNLILSLYCKLNNSVFNLSTIEFNNLSNKKYIYECVNSNIYICNNLSIIYAISIIYIIIISTMILMLFMSSCCC